MEEHSTVGAHNGGALPRQITSQEEFLEHSMVGSQHEGTQLGALLRGITAIEGSTRGGTQHEEVLGGQHRACGMMTWTPPLPVCRDPHRIPFESRCAKAGPPALWSKERLRPLAPALTLCPGYTKPEKPSVVGPGLGCGHPRQGL